MQLPKVYEPQQYEADIYALWEKSGAFEPKQRGSDDTYSIVLPPPNANGNLHVGHSLMFAIQDAVIRYHRMKGERTLWLPGADHAGFESQVTYEKQLAKQGKSRFDFNREELYQQIWDFVALNRRNYETQFRRLGASVDWSRYTYTLDEKIIKRAYDTFKKMWDEGLIYRGERLVNYCTHHRTGFADIEVEYEDAVTPLYYLKYGPFELATTRPETKFGDTAVAVHPDDKRYHQWVGKVVTVEGVNGPFEVQVIADEMVDPDFGTGVVKITPAHSFDDWEVAQRHHLPAVRVINHDGTMNEKAGRFRGMTVLEARKAVVAALKEQGLLIKVDDKYTNRVGKCYKCGTVIEPMLLEQWFVDMQPLAKPAIKSLKNNEITFYPTSKRDQLITYIEGLRDWNISRQIAWGIPIPAFQNVDDGDDWIFDTRVDQEIIEVDGKTYHRDPDVFDTWFSSSSWPYATLDYPGSDDFKDFYPLSLMETGGEILYPWVSRMVMLGLYVTGKVPFKEVYIHGYVLAEDGSKMSKSVGNVIDPIDAIDKYGSDALRMGLLAGRAPAVNRGYDPRRVEEARNFCNKLWNVARFIEAKIGDEPHLRHTPEPTTLADLWILTKLNAITDYLSSCLTTYRLSEGYEALYHFIWDDLADWYIEASKQAVNKSVLGYVLETTLKLAHPFAPFVTETIWQTLKWEGDSLLIVSTWPEPLKLPDHAAAHTASSTFEAIKAVVSEVRYLKTTLQLGNDVTLGYQGTDASSLVRENGELISRLAGLAALTPGEAVAGLRLSSVPFTMWLVVDEATAKRFADSLATKRDTLATSVKQLKARLSNASYVEHAPKHLVEESRGQLAAAEAALATVNEEYKRYTS